MLKSIKVNLSKIKLLNVLQFKYLFFGHFSMKMPEVRVASVLEQEEANGNIEADASQSSQ